MKYNSNKSLSLEEYLLKKEIDKRKALKEMIRLIDTYNITLQETKEEYSRVHPEENISLWKIIINKLFNK